MEEIKSLKKFALGFKGVLCDLWGVIHDGKQAFPEAIQALIGLKKEGKFILLLSNSPRPSGAVGLQITSLGVPVDAYDVIVTSGDLARNFLTKEARGKSFFHLGPTRDRATFDGLANPEEQALGAADYILCTGFFEDRPLDTALYETLLREAMGRDMPLICANPDREVDIGGKRFLCAGALAEFYQRLGGRVVWLGKPKKIAYDSCFDAIKKKTGRIIKPADLLAIGDNLETDIAGASKVGIKTILVTEGLHGHMQIGDKDFEALMNRLNVRPDAIMRRLKWK